MSENDQFCTGISCIAARVAPLRARRIINKTTTTKKAQAVLTAERVIIVCLLSASPRVFIARMVPVAEVIPGMIETRTPAKDPVIIDKIPDFFVVASSEGFTIFCFGIFGFVISDVSRVGKPNKPDNAGNNTGESSPIGDETGRSSATNPNMPERMKRNSAKIMPRIAGKIPVVPKSVILPFSVAIIRMVIARRTKNIISCRVS